MYENSLVENKNTTKTQHKHKTNLKGEQGNDNEES